MQTYNLQRFLDAHNQMYLTALAEVRAGKKTTHWMWFIFPQLQSLGSSTTAKFYAISDTEEANAYLTHRVLGKHLIEISEELLCSEGQTAALIFGTPDDKKLRSCMTLFSAIQGSDQVFGKVLKKYFEGKPDEKTLILLEQSRPISN